MEDLQSGSGCFGRAVENFSLLVPLGRRGNVNRWVEGFVAFSSGSRKTGGGERER